MTSAIGAIYALHHDEWPHHCDYVLCLHRFKAREDVVSRIHGGTTYYSCSDECEVYARHLRKAG